jgi:hypothetical protein
VLYCLRAESILNIAWRNCSALETPSGVGIQKGSIKRMLAPCLNFLLCLAQLDSNTQNMPVRKEGQ